MVVVPVRDCSSSGLCRGILGASHDFWGSLHPCLGPHMRCSRCARSRRGTTSGFTPQAEAARPARSEKRKRAMKKLPQITALFWVTKIAATTLGETGGDLLAQTLHI